MNTLSNKKALVIGGGGFVGEEVVKKLEVLKVEMNYQICVVDLPGKAEKVADKYGVDYETGNILLPTSLMGWTEKEIFDDSYRRKLYYQYLYESHNPAESFLYQLIKNERPNWIISTVPIATGLAYGPKIMMPDIELGLQRIDQLGSVCGGNKDQAKITFYQEQVERLILSNPIQKTIRFVDNLAAALQDFEVESFVQVLTLGTGGMGRQNILFTHGEAQRNRSIDTKNCCAGSIVWQLEILRRSLINKNCRVGCIIPGAAIGIGPIEIHEPVVIQGRKLEYLDSQPAKYGKSTTQPLDQPFRGVGIPSGENGFGTPGEFNALAQLMGLILGEEVADSVLSFLLAETSQGYFCQQNYSGCPFSYDVLGSLGEITLHPSVAAQTAITLAVETARKLQKEHQLPLLYYGTYGYKNTIANAMAETICRLSSTPDQFSLTESMLWEKIVNDPELRRAILSAGIIICNTDHDCLGQTSGATEDFDDFTKRENVIYLSPELIAGWQSVLDRIDKAKYNPDDLAVEYLKSKGCGREFPAEKVSLYCE